MPGDPVPLTAPVVTHFTLFRAFWRDVEEVKSEVTRGTFDGSKARARLLAVLRAQETDLARTADASAMKDYRDAQYVMAAVADDAFVRLDWRGAEEWMMNPLETDLFGSRCAGQLVFDRIDQLIAGTSPGGRERAGIYVTALALGFEGKYAGVPGGNDALADCRQRLRALFAGDVKAVAGPIVPQCYQSTMAVGTGRLLRSARPWWWAAAAVVGIWLIVASLLWLEVRSSAVDEMSRADAARTGGAR